MGRAADLTRALLAALLVAALAGLVALRAARRRRYRAQAAVPRELLAAAPVTLVYFTSRRCAECALTPGLAREAAPEVPVRAVPLHERPDLARAFGVFETPTVLLADARGRVRYARVGNPSVEELREALASSLAAASPPRAS